MLYPSICLLAVEQRTGRVTEERKKHWLPVGRRVARAFQAPIQALKLDPKKLTSGQLHRYVNLMQHAMLALCPDEIVERTFFQPDVPRPGQADAVAADAPEPEELQAP